MNEELGIELVGDIKVKVDIREDEDSWDDIVEDDIDKIKEDYIDENTI